MKQFQNLIEATTYHGHCYVCGWTLCHNMMTRMEQGRYPIFKWNLSENVDSTTDDLLSINGVTNEITYYEQHRRSNDELIYGVDGNLVERITRFPKQPKNIYDGIIYEPIHIQCGHCHQFSYTVQVIIDMVKKTLAGLYLNSELISYKDEKGCEHILRNVYALERTEYDYSVEPTEQFDGSRRQIEIPLIPLNLSNPAETVARIRKLATFS